MFQNNKCYFQQVWVLRACLTSFSCQVCSRKASMSLGLKQHIFLRTYNFQKRPEGSTALLSFWHATNNPDSKSLWTHGLKQPNPAQVKGRLQSWIVAHIKYCAQKSCISFMASEVFSWHDGSRWNLALIAHRPCKPVNFIGARTSSFKSLHKHKWLGTPRCIYTSRDRGSLPFSGGLMTIKK